MHFAAPHLLLTVVGFATLLRMPQFIEAAVADLGYTEQQVGVLSSVVMVCNTSAHVAASMWVRRSSWWLVASVALDPPFITRAAQPRRP